MGLYHDNTQGAANQAFDILDLKEKKPEMFINNWTLAYKSRGVQLGP